MHIERFYGQSFKNWAGQCRQSLQAMQGGLAEMFLYFLHVVYYGSEFLTNAETPFVLETGKVAKLSPGI